MSRQAAAFGFLACARIWVLRLCSACARSGATEFARCSASAALRTLEYTHPGIQGYMRLPSRLSEHAVLEQWQPHPNTTGPASLPYSWHVERDFRKPTRNHDSHSDLGSAACGQGLSQRPSLSRSWGTTLSLSLSQKLGPVSSSSMWMASAGAAAVRPSLVP